VIVAAPKFENYRIAPLTAVIVLLTPGGQQLGPVDSAFYRLVEITVGSFVGLGVSLVLLPHRTAIFRQVNKDKSAAHHDALEFPDGRTVLLTLLCEGQAATVLQLPAQPATASEADGQKRVTSVG
jgi:hypothetical protein